MVPQRTVVSIVVLCTCLHVNHLYHHHQVSSRQMAHKAMRARAYVCIIYEETKANSLENIAWCEVGKTKHTSIKGLLVDCLWFC